MPGKTPQDALAEYVKPLRKSLNCVSPQFFAYPKPTVGLEQDLLVHHAGGIPVTSKDGKQFLLSFHHKFVIEQLAKRTFKIKTLEYRYALDETLEGELSEVFEYHWHPRRKFRFPHIHVTGHNPNFHKMHLPTCRIAFEDFLLCVIDEFRVPAIKSDYRDILLKNRRAFFSHCEWHWDWAKPKI